MKKYQNLPFQVSELISNIQDKNNPIHVRSNYRSRLLDIKEAAEEAIRQFDAVANMRK